MTARTATLMAVALLALGAATAADTPPPLGWLSKQYEVGSGGPGTVSGGQGDAGGVSYGTYQMNTKDGVAQAFVNKNYAADFKGLTSGTPAFTAKWKELAKADPTGFGQAQHDYIKSTHYDPVVSALSGDGLDVSKRSSALQNVIWSTGVQHGVKGAEGVVEKALAAQIKAGTVGQMSDEDIIKAIYAERGRKDAKGNLVHFSRNSAKVQEGVAARFVSEQAKALKALADEQAAKKTPDPKPADPKPKDAPPPTGQVVPGKGEYYEIDLAGKKISEAATKAEADALAVKYQKFYNKPATVRGPLSHGSAQKTDPKTPNPTGKDDPFKVSEGQFTFDVEGTEGGPNQSRAVSWPGGVSGVTIGRGYDMGGVSAATIVADMTAAGMSKADAEVLAKAAGLTGADAKKWVADNKATAPSLTPEQQKKLFEDTFKGYVTTTANLIKKDYGVDYAGLDPTMRSILADMVYRGDSPGFSKFQKLLGDAIKSNDLNKLLTAMSDTDFWKTERGAKTTKTTMAIDKNRFDMRIKAIKDAIAAQKK